jgi:hypothetical protein
MEKWLACLISGLEEHVDEEHRVKVLEQCGRQCQSQSLVTKAKSIYKKSKNKQEFLENFAKVYKQLHFEGENVYIVYPRCFCSFVNKISQGELSSTWCNCSRGWVKELFEGALGRPVEVALEKSIVKGDEECRFKIHI